MFCPFCSLKVSCQNNHFAKADAINEDHVSLTEKQTGVLKGMIIGAAIAVAIVVVGIWYDPFHFSESASEIDRLSISITSALLPGPFPVISVARLARHRFFFPEDIDGGGSAQDSRGARVLQSLLQNTLEQFCIAFIVYSAWAMVMPASWMSVVPLAAIAFAIGIKAGRSGL